MRSYALAVALFATCAAAPLAMLPGCSAAGVVAALPTVAEIVSDGVAILGMVNSAAETYFRAHPDNSKQAAIASAIQKAQAALVAGGQALAGVEHVTTGQTAAAFADFATAYEDLMALVAPLGIVPAQPIADGGALMAAPGTVIPIPLALRATRK